MEAMLNTPYVELSSNSIAAPYNPCILSLDQAPISSNTCCSYEQVEPGEGEPNISVSNRPYWVAYIIITTTLNLPYITPNPLEGTLYLPLRDPYCLM